MEIDCYSRADLVGLEEYVYLLDRDFSHVEEANNADDSWTFLKGEIKHSSSLFVPKIRIPSSHSPKWFTAEIRHNVKKASTARRQVRKNPTPGRIQKLDRTEQTLQNQITAAKESYIANLLHTFASD